MRGKRSKQYRKLMHQYALHFGFREPYQVLLDAEILRDAARFKMNFITGLEKALHGPVKPMITQCSMRHLYASEASDSIVLEHAKAFERRRCNHHTLEKPLSSLECLTSVVDPKASKTNKNRYVVASQDDKVRAYMRTVPGVPLIYLKRSVMIMEPMAAATEKVTAKEERSKFRMGLRDQKQAAGGTKRARDDDDDEDNDKDDTVGRQATIHESVASPERTQQPKKKRKRGPSGPNPLSVKKTKVQQEGKESTTHVRSARKEVTSTIDAISTEPKTIPLDEVAKHKRKRRHRSGKENLATTSEPTARSQMLPDES